MHMDASQHSKWCGSKDVPINGFSGEGIIIREAADRLTALDAENAKLREALGQIEDHTEIDDNGEEALSEPAHIARSALPTSPQGGEHE